MKIENVNSPAFREYGRVLQDCPAASLIAAAEKIAMPESGSRYLASEPSLEACPETAFLRDRLFGELPIQVGYCWGHSNRMNAMEWHTSSEVNVAVTPLVLLLGRVQDVEDGKLDAAKVKAFYVEAGQAIEVYATTLHFCPCEVRRSGFGSIVVLPVGTNLPLERPSDDPLLFRKNKWLIAHEANRELIARGAVPGIYGENYEIPVGD